MSEYLDKLKEIQKKGFNDTFIEKYNIKHTNDLEAKIEKIEKENISNKKKIYKLINKNIKLGSKLIKIRLKRSKESKKHIRLLNEFNKNKIIWDTSHE